MKKKTLLYIAFAICMLFSAGVMLSACGDSGLKENELEYALEDKVYDGTALDFAAVAKGEAEVTIEYKLADADDETYTEEAPKNVGSYVIRVKVEKTDKYEEMELELNFQILPKEVEVEWTAPASLVYDKSAKVPTIEITGGVVANDECNISGQLKADNDNVNVGTFTYVASLDNANYKLAANDAEREYEISQKQLVVEWDEPENLVYDKQAKVATVAITSGVEDGDECNITATLKANNDNVNVGTFAYVASIDNANYKLAAADVEREFDIACKQVTVQWTAPENLVYDTEAKVATVAITNGVVAGDECNITATLKAGNDNVNAGTFAYVAALDNANYVLANADVERSYTISNRE